MTQQTLVNQIYTVLLLGHYAHQRSSSELLSVPVRYQICSLVKTGGVPVCVRGKSLANHWYYIDSCTVVLIAIFKVQHPNSETICKIIHSFQLFSLVLFGETISRSSIICPRFEKSHSPKARNFVCYFDASLAGQRLHNQIDAVDDDGIKASICLCLE